MSNQEGEVSGTCSRDGINLKNLQTWVGNLNKRDQLENMAVVGSILLKWVSRKYADEVWPRFIWLRVGNYQNFV
jgi:hypothetical protein